MDRPAPGRRPNHHRPRHLRKRPWSAWRRSGRHLRISATGVRMLGLIVILIPFLVVGLIVPSSPMTPEPTNPTNPSPVTSIRSEALGALVSNTTPEPPPPLPPGGTFFDDDNSIHEAQIEAIHAAAITRGCSSTVEDLFCPRDPVTRGEMAAFLTRALDLPRPEESPFRDTEGIFESDIAALAAAGITTGCGPDTFCPDDSVTRGEMAAFLVRALDLPPADEQPFTDANGVFAADIAALAAARITTGCGPDTYCPRDPVTREEMASFLTRAFHLTPNKPPERPAFTMSFTGDTLIHSQLYQRAARHGDESGRGYDFRPMFDEVTDVISESDLALCHLEVPLSPDSRDLSGYPLFNAPAELASDLVDVGYEGCSVASNHSIDQGVSGLIDTIEIMEDAGLEHAGTYRSESDADEVTVYEVGDATIAHLSATYGLNGLVLPDGEEWRVDMLDVDHILEQAEQARAEGADLVVASIHCCVEYQIVPPSEQEWAFTRLIESDSIDLVVGHHAHVVQPMDVIDEEYVVYGLGNFLSAQRTVPRADGVVVTVEYTQRGERWVTRGIRYVPTEVENHTWDIEIATGSSRSRTIDAIEMYDPKGVELVGG